MLPSDLAAIEVSRFAREALLRVQVKMSAGQLGEAFQPESDNGDARNSFHGARLVAVPV